MNAFDFNPNDSRAPAIILNPNTGEIDEDHPGKRWRLGTAVRSGRRHEHRVGLERV